MATSWTFVNNATTITVTRTVDMFGGTIHSDIFICNKQLIKTDSTEPLLFFLYSNPDDLNYHQFDVNYTLVTSPVSTSAADLESQVRAMITGGGGVEWEVISTDTHQLENNKGYIIDNVNLCVLTLPVTSAEGDLILIVGKSANGWKVTQNAGQQIFVGTTSTVLGAGSGIESTAAHDCAELVCITTDTEYDVRNISPNTTINTFVPFLLPDLLWLDAALGVTESGGAVSAWADQSGAGNDFAQSTGANQPTLVAAALNGLPIVRFDGVNDRMFTPSSVLPDTAQTIFFVTKANTVHDGAVLSTYGGTGFLIRYRTNAGTLEFRFFSATALDGVVSNPSAYHVFCIKVLGTTGVAGTNTIYEDGGSIATASFTTDAHLTNLTIGATSGGGQDLNGDIAEIMIYTGGLSDADRGDIENYLMTKYGL